MAFGSGVQNQSFGCLPEDLLEPTKKKIYILWSWWFCFRNHPLSIQEKCQFLFLFGLLIFVFLCLNLSTPTYNAIQQNSTSEVEPRGQSCSDAAAVGNLTLQVRLFLQQQTGSHGF